LVELVEDLETVEYLLNENDRPSARERKLGKTADALRGLAEDYANRRMDPPLEESAVAYGEFKFSWGEEPEADLELRRRNARLRQLPNLRRLLFSLAPDEFESLCGLVLRRAGCDAVTVTKTQGDDGVDFIARLRVVGAFSAGPPSTLYRVAGDTSLLLYGQAKRYSLRNVIQKDHINSLSGSWNVVRSKRADGSVTPDQQSALARAGFRDAMPALLVFATTGRYASGALQAAESIGCITLDGEQIAQLLLHEAVGILELPDGEYVASLDILRNDIAGWSSSC
jgi:hypothetical protein